MQSVKAVRLGISVSVNRLVATLLFSWRLCDALADLSSDKFGIRCILFSVVVLRDRCISNRRIVKLSVKDEGPKDFITV